MCGIVGSLGFVDTAVLKRMKAALYHRGPDQEGEYVDEEVMLGHRRLSILDLSLKGRQPVFNEDGSIVVVFNGEIYNFLSLRKELEEKGHQFTTQTDTEVLAHGYEEWQESLPSHLDGDFAFALWDANSKKLFLARDPLGVVPLYYTQTKDAFFFASEIKAFFEYENIRRELNSDALDDYLTFRYTIAPDTMFKNIFKVKPGESLCVEKKQILHRKFFNLYYSEDPISETEAVETVRRLFADAVKKRLQSDVPLGAYLSGGLDSSWIVAQMSEFVQPHTFSVAFGTEDDETPFVEAVVSKFDTKHTLLHVQPRENSIADIIAKVAWHFDEPHAEDAAIPTYLMAEQTKKHVTVVLTGDGGDEVFAGYARYPRLLLAEKFRSLPSEWTMLAKAFAHSATGQRLKEAVSSKNRTGLFLGYTAAFSENEKREMDLKSRNDAAAKTAQYFSNSDHFLNQMLAFDTATLLPDDYLMKVNKTSMAFGVEARVPFLDQAIVKYATKLPVKFKANIWHTKILQRKVMRQLGIPKTILERKKHGFVSPTELWLESGLNDVAEDCFESLDRRGLFKAGVGQRILKNFSKSRKYYTRQFWTLLGLEIWHRIYLDADRPKKPKGFPSAVV